MKSHHVRVRITLPIPKQKGGGVATSVNCFSVKKLGGLSISVIEDKQKRMCGCVWEKEESNSRSIDCRMQW